MHPTTKRKDEIQGIFLYTLKLQRDKYYVGISNNTDRRLKQHQRGKTVDFVKNNLPIDNFERTRLETSDRDLALQFETKKTIELIRKFGIENICGGAITGNLHERIAKFQDYFSKLGTQSFKVFNY